MFFRRPVMFDNYVDLFLLFTSAEEFVISALGLVAVIAVVLLVMITPHRRSIRSR